MDRITRVRIQNVRAIEQVDLELGRPLTVLIGENGAGKSTIIECLELLRRAADPNFLQAFYNVHRGMPALLRKGASELTLGVRIEEDRDQGDVLDYSFTLRQVGAGVAVAAECLRNGRDGFEILVDSGSGARAYSSRGWVDAHRTPAGLALSAFGMSAPDPRIDRALAALRGIEVHLPFDTRASWGARTYQQPESLRVAATLFPAERLSLFGFNLANAWNELLSRPTAEREHTLALLRLGLGDRVDTVVIRPDPGGGNVYLALRFKDMPDLVFAGDLSDGQLAWLSFVALAGLNPGRALLAVDEPELHLHPSLLGRVVSLLGSLPGGSPVVLSTHSDRVLELLDDPADSVRVCNLRGSRAEVSRIDATELPRWLEQFGDLGQLRAAGYLPRVLKQMPPDGSRDEGAG
jgi:predicted ATPase